MLSAASCDGDLVEVARQAMAPPLRVAHHLARLQDRAQLVVEIERVDDFQSLDGLHATWHYS